MYPENIHPTAIINPNCIIHPTAKIGPYCVIGSPPEDLKNPDKAITPPVIIGKNVNITKMVSIDGGVEVPTSIGEGVTIMAHSHIGHDVKVGLGSVVCSGAIIGGHVKIHQRCFVGLGAVLNPRVILPPYVKVGSQSKINRRWNRFYLPFRVYSGLLNKITVKSARIHQECLPLWFPDGNHQSIIDKETKEWLK